MWKAWSIVSDRPEVTAAYLNSVCAALEAQKVVLFVQYDVLSVGGLTT